MAIDPKLESRFSQDPDVVELERLESRLHLMAKTGEYFEPDTLEGEDASTPASKKVQKLLERRRELIEAVRPQCVDADGSELADEIEKMCRDEFGLDDWGEIDTRIKDE